MQTFFARAVVGSLLALGATDAFGQDRCIALIQNGLYNTYRSASGNSNMSQAQSQFCSDYSSYKQTGVQGNLGVSYGLFSGSANYSQSQIEAVGQAVCSASFSASSASSMLNSFASIIDQGSIAAFNTCVEAGTKGLIYELNASAVDPNTLSVSARYVQSLGAPTPQRVDSVTISQDANLATLQQVQCVGELFSRGNQPNGVTLSSEVLSMTCTRSTQGASAQGFSYFGRQVYAAPVRVVVNTNVGAIIADLPLLPIARPAPPATLVPVGTVVAFAGEAEPTGWMKADGRPVSRTEYGALFSAIGVAHGSGDGVSTFNLPDYRGRFLRGVSTDADGRDADRASRTAPQNGGNSGAKVGSVEGDQFKSHDHEGGDHTHTTAVQNGAAAGFGQLIVRMASPPIPQAQFPSETSKSGKIVKLDGGSETRPANANVHYIIKVKS